MKVDVILTESAYHCIGLTLTTFRWEFNAERVYVVVLNQSDEEIIAKEKL
jgi:hypothetical protein